MKRIYNATIWLPIVSSAHGGRIVKRCDLHFDIEAPSDADAAAQARNIAAGLHLPAAGERTPNGNPAATFDIRPTGTLYPVSDAPELRYFGDRYLPGMITGLVLYDEGRTIGLRFEHDGMPNTATYAMWGGCTQREWEDAKRSILAKLNVKP